MGLFRPGSSGNDRNGKKREVSLRGSLRRQEGEKTGELTFDFYGGNKQRKLEDPPL